MPFNQNIIVEPNKTLVGIRLLEKTYKTTQNTIKYSNSSHQTSKFTPSCHTEHNCHMHALCTNAHRMNTDTKKQPTQFITRLTNLFMWSGHASLTKYSVQNMALCSIYNERYKVIQYFSAVIKS